MTARPARLASRAAALAASLALAALCGACGYHVVGLGGQLPGGVSRIEVPIFENHTTRSDAGRILTDEFIRQLLASGKIKMSRGDEAQAVIVGTLTTYRRDPITFDAKQKPLENRLTLVMDVSLVSRPGKRTLFNERGVMIRVDYPVKEDLQANDRLEDEALRTASTQMSQKLVGLMLEGF